MNNESQNDSKVVTVYLVNLYIYLSLIFFMSNWFVVYFMTINKTDFIISTLYFGPPLIILITYLFRHRTLKFAYEHENEIKLLGSFMRLFLYIFTTRFFYGLNGNTKTMKGVYIFCFQASLISFYVSFTIRNGHYLSSLFLFVVLDSIFQTFLEILIGDNSIILSANCQGNNLNIMDSKIRLKKELKEKTEQLNEVNFPIDSRLLRRVTHLLEEEEYDSSKSNFNYFVPSNRYIQYCLGAGFGSLFAYIFFFGGLDMKYLEFNVPEKIDDDIVSSSDDEEDVTVNKNNQPPAVVDNKNNQPPAVVNNKNNQPPAVVNNKNNNVSKKEDVVGDQNFETTVLKFESVENVFHKTPSRHELYASTRFPEHYEVLWRILQNNSPVKSCYNVHDVTIPDFRIARMSIQSTEKIKLYDFNIGLVKGGQSTVVLSIIANINETEQYKVYFNKFKMAGYNVTQETDPYNLEPNSLLYSIILKNVCISLVTIGTEGVTKLNTCDHEQKIHVNKLVLKLNKKIKANKILFYNSEPIKKINVDDLVVRVLLQTYNLGVSNCTIDYEQPLRNGATTIVLKGTSKNKDGEYDANGKPLMSVFGLFLRGTDNNVGFLSNDWWNTIEQSGDVEILRVNDVSYWCRGFSRSRALFKEN